MLKNIIRALRLPFVTASILPFIFGSLIQRHHFNFAGFLLGLIAVVSTHLSSNLINDYADSKSGADWKDKNFYGFFGGSKLIQEKIFPEGFYLKLSITFALIAAFSVIALALLLKNPLVVVLYALIIIIGWQYSAKPLQFSYHMLGEIVIFMLFGPALVMGGYFIQTGIFPDLKSFILSAPFGFFTTAILFSNEIPDFQDDKASGKLTWVNFFGPQGSYILYVLFILLGFYFISLSMLFGFLGKISIIAFLLLALAFKAALILKSDYADKIKLMESSKLTIALQALVSIVLIAGLLI